MIVTSLQIKTNAVKLLTIAFIGMFSTLSLFAQENKTTKAKDTVTRNISYLKSGTFIDDEGNPVSKTTCSTGWALVPKSDPKMYRCAGTHYGSGPLQFRTKSASSGYLENGGYFDENAGLLNLTYCSTGWVLIPGTVPARYSCSGTVFGSGPLAPMLKSNQGSSGFLESGKFIDSAGNPVELTYCSTGWNLIPNSNPARYTCAGEVSGSGKLNL